MKSTSFAFLLASLLSVAAPADAQQIGAGDEFLTAVRQRDGGKAQEVLGRTASSVVNVRGSNGETPLTIAVERRDSTWTGFLLNQGANPNLAGKGGDTALIIAARIGFDQAVQWLLESGAKVDATNRMGETALITAVVQRQPQTVRRLLAAGADPDKTDAAAGYSARDYAQRDTRARDILAMIEARKPKK